MTDVGNTGKAHYQAERDGVALRSDGVHLTQEGTQLAWRWLDAELRQVLADR